MSQALRKLSGAIKQTNTVMIFTNQLRQKIGVMFGNPETTTGGMALKFYASVRLTSFTERNGGSGALAVGNHVRVRGKAGAGNSIIATRLDLRSADTRVELQAAVQAASPESSVRLIGVDIATGVGLVYRDASGGPIDRTAFFAGATVGKLVKARGTLGAGGVTWSELELEN